MMLIEYEQIRISYAHAAIYSATMLFDAGVFPKFLLLLSCNWFNYEVYNYKKYESYII